VSEQRLRVNVENVVHEEVDGEVIAIDLGGGSYYSLAGSGPAIWEILVAGASEAEVCAALGTRWDAEAETIQAAVSGLLAQLQECGLVVAAGEGAAPTPVLAGAAGEKLPFEPPRFERYDDMKDYFLLDPIHEVNPAAGWPKPAA
jgi:hypothetical protein